MQKNVASQRIGAQMVSATDGSNFTGAVVVYVTGDAGTQAVGSVGAGACTHEGKGYHTYAPAQAETNYDLIAFTFEGTGAVTATVQVETRCDANVTQLGGSTQSLTDLKDLADTGYDPVAHKIAGVVLVDLATLVSDITTKTGFTLAGTTTTFDALQTALSTAHGAGSWATATGFAVAGSAMTLTSGERTAIANEVETQIIDETDCEKVLTAITDKIASVNPDLGGLTVAAIASAVWANATRTLSATQAFDNTGTWTGNLVGTVSTLTTYTGNTPQTGDSFARIGALGAGLTALAQASVWTPTRGGHIDNLSGGAVMLASSYTAPDNSGITAINAKTTNLPASPAAVGSAMTLTAGERTAIGTAMFITPMVESYAAAGVAPTFAQALFMTMQRTMQFSISGTTITVQKLDETTAFTLTMNSSTAPTSSTRAA